LLAVVDSEADSLVGAEAGGNQLTLSAL
jgi:hypothetical protein